MDTTGVVMDGDGLISHYRAGLYTKPTITTTVTTTTITTTTWKFMSTVRISRMFSVFSRPLDSQRSKLLEGRLQASYSYTHRVAQK